MEDMSKATDNKTATDDHNPSSSTKGEPDKPGKVEVGKIFHLLDKILKNIIRKNRSLIFDPFWYANITRYSGCSQIIQTVQKL